METYKTNFINISNHPSSKWSAYQRICAVDRTFGNGEIIDVPFPNVNPLASSEEVKEIAKKLVSSLPADKYGTNVYHVMGEMTLTYAIIKCLRRRKGAVVEIVASTTERETIENPDGTKTSIFTFRQFRQYPD